MLVALKVQLKTDINGRVIHIKALELECKEKQC